MEKETGFLSSPASKVDTRPSSAPGPVFISSGATVWSFAKDSVQSGSSRRMQHPSRSSQHYQLESLSEDARPTRTLPHQV